MIKKESDRKHYLKYHSEHLCAAKQYRDEHKELLRKNQVLFRKNNPWITHFNNARYRCNNPNAEFYYCYGAKGIKFNLTIDEIKELWFKYNASEMNRPSIDRIKSDKDYTVDNCRFIEWGENSAERNTRVCSKPVIQYTLKGDFIKEWKSASEVEKQSGIGQSNISLMCRNKRNKKSAGGYIWKFKTA